MGHLQYFHKYRFESSSCWLFIKLVCVTIDSNLRNNYVTLIVYKLSLSDSKTKTHTPYDCTRILFSRIYFLSSYPGSFDGKWKVSWSHLKQASESILQACLLGFRQLDSGCVVLPPSLNQLCCRQCHVQFELAGFRFSCGKFVVWTRPMLEVLNSNFYIIDFI